MTLRKRYVWFILLAFVVVPFRVSSFPQEGIPPAAEREAVSTDGMVVSSFPDATRAGARMLAAGGNAIDAAVATAFALGVCEPWASGLGGQSYLLVHLQNGRTVAIDGSSIAPEHFNLEELKQGRNRLVGYKSATVPSTLAALTFALQQYGTKSLADVLAPAIEIAEHGYRITPLQHSIWIENLEDLRKSEGARKDFLKNGNDPWEAGDLFIQPELAYTLKRIAEKGPDVFYHGEMAEAIEADMIRHGGYIRKEDLAAIHITEREPVRGRHRGYEIVSFPFPRSGETVLEMLNILEAFKPKFFKSESPDLVQATLEAMHIALVDSRANHPDANVPPAQRDRHLIDKRFARQRAKLIRFDHPLDEKLLTPEPGEPDDDSQTTHLSTADRWGNAVSLTQSICLYHGANVATPGLGFLYNDYMQTFDYRHPDNPYFIKPHGIFHSSKSPTMIFKNGQLFMVVGSPASPRIITAIVQTITNVLDRKMTLHDAVFAPRIHYSGSVVSIEALSPLNVEIIRTLKDRGYKVKEYKVPDKYFGGVQAILYNAKKKTFTGVADPRRDGIALGPEK
ncbi:MAG: gamma-glutamyltransferase [Acidobacteriia bacterium]|nr:gamma-glutamyltransferase [Terriglobia bacterium]